MLGQSLKLGRSTWRIAKRRQGFSLKAFASGALPGGGGERPSHQLAMKEDCEVKLPSKTAELMAAFTCNKCGVRTGVAFSKVAYERGIVIARCSSCNVQHLISDQLGWFGEKANIEDILKEKGESFRKSGADGVLALSPEDLESWSKH